MTDAVTFLQGLSVGPPWLRSTVDWAADTAYFAAPSASAVYFDGSLYECKIAHTSSDDFTADLEAGKWQIVVSAQLSAEGLAASEAAVAAAVATGEDAAATASDRTQTGLDRVATGQDKTGTAADRVATGQDRTATAADRVQTGLDRIQTGQDATATAADRVQTGADVVTANAAAAASAGARDASIVNAQTYATEAAGRAAVADGATFDVQGSGDVASYRYRRTNSTTSVLIATFPSKGAVDTLSTQIGPLAAVALPPEGGYVAAIVDSLRQAALLIGTDATVEIPKLSLAAGAVLRPALSADLQASMLSPISTESGYLFAIRDTSGQIAFGARADGTIYGTIDRALLADSSFPVGAARENATHVVIPFKDGSQKWQIRAYRKSDGQLFTLTSLGNNVDPQITSDNRVLFWTDNGGLGLAYIPVEGGSIQRVDALPDIACWGDSLTYGVGASNGSTDYPAQLAVLLGRSVYNGGIGGQRSWEIIAREGGASMMLTISGDTIPATTTDVAITAQSIVYPDGSTAPTGTLLNGQGPTALTGTLAGIAGTYRWSSGPTFAFRRSVAGSAVSCPPGTPFIPVAAGLYENRTVLLEIGRNNRNGSDQIRPENAPQIIKDYQAGIDFLKPYAKRVALWTILNGTNEAVGGTTGNSIIAINDAIKAAFPGMWIDGQSPPSSDEMTTLGFTPDATDLTDIAAGCIPTRMRATADPLHLNAAGYALYALRAQRFLTAKGW